MNASNLNQAGNAWLVFALMTVAAWGLYGVFLHSGQTFMKDPAAGRYKAFLFVGVAYFLIAVLTPLGVLWFKGATWQFTASGMAWSLLAGTVGAIGAFCVLVAFGTGGSPSVVMSIIFAGAPVVNAVVALSMHPPAGGVRALPWQFMLGIVLAAVGGCLVTLYKPAPARAGHPTAQMAPAAERHQTVELSEPH
jgi:uncharacterized membrane protein YeaQ/YmgE (transglycosylase-associated protein family)